MSQSQFPSQSQSHSSSPSAPPSSTTNPSRGRFIALEVSFEAISVLEPLVARLRTRSARLVKQIEDAATSVSLNLAEGAERGGRDRLQHYLVALGSCKEASAGLRAALAWKYLTPAQVEPAIAVLDRLGALLYGLTHKRA